MKCDKNNRFPRMTISASRYRGVEAVLADRRRFGYSALVGPAAFEPVEVSSVDVFAEAKRWVDARVAGAVRHYRRDTLWSKMLAGSPALGDAGVTGSELFELLGSVGARYNFSDIDASLENLLQLEAISWPQMHDVLSAQYGERVRHIAVNLSGAS